MFVQHSVCLAHLYAGLWSLVHLTVWTWITLLNFVQCSPKTKPVKYKILTGISVIGKSRSNLRLNVFKDIIRSLLMSNMVVLWAVYEQKKCAIYWGLLKLQPWQQDAFEAVFHCNFIRFLSLLLIMLYLMLDYPKKKMWVQFYNPSFPRLTTVIFCLTVSSQLDSPVWNIALMSRSWLLSK